MNFLCNTCNMHITIEKYRLMLNNLIVKKNYDLLDEEIINLSQYLDVLVCKCAFCDGNLNNILKLNLKDILGTRSDFYYYDYYHLFNSMYF